MNEKLANALADITTKDNLVNQHVKVAEEAVTGKKLIVMPKYGDNANP